MIERIELDFDVTGALPAEVIEGARAVISGWLFLPPDGMLPGVAPRAMVLVAGGSYDKRYHDVHVPGRGGYSAAEHLAALGNIVLLNDHLGIGDSTRLPDQKKATRHICAQAAHAACMQFFEGLEQGTLHPSLAPLPDVVRVGGGHSMGGMMTILQQADHATFDGIMIIGYTADSVQMTSGGHKFPVAASLPAKEDAPDYTQSDRGPMHETFHWDDVPADVIAHDDTLSVEVPANIGMDSVRHHIVTNEAARIDVPVYICQGERDNSPDAHLEPAFYRASRDIMLHILPHAAHCQSFAGTRHELWDRMHHWSGGLSRRAY